jgi:hypothetical protein
MARSYLVFGDIEGKLEVLRVECTRWRRPERNAVMWTLFAIAAVVLVGVWNFCLARCPSVLH